MEEKELLVEDGKEKIKAIQSEDNSLAKKEDLMFYVDNSGNLIPQTIPVREYDFDIENEQQQEILMLHTLRQRLDVMKKIAKKTKDDCIKGIYDLESKRQKTD